MSIEALQQLLDKSLASSSSFTRSLEGEERSAEQVEEFINGARNVTVAVVRSNGLPHAAPVIGGCVDGEIYVTVSPGSLLSTCLQRSPEAAITVTDLVHSLIGAGTAENLGRVAGLSTLCDRLDNHSPFGSFAPSGWDGFIYAFHPRRLFAW